VMPSPLNGNCARVECPVQSAGVGLPGLIVWG